MLDVVDTPYTEDGFDGGVISSTYVEVCPGLLVQ